MTTNDLSSGRSAANRRPLSGFHRISCFALFGAAMCFGTPALAQDASAAVVATAATTATTVPTNVPVSDAMPLPDRAILFAGDINRLIASQPLTATSAEPAPSGRRVQTLLSRALALLGTPYRWGGTSTSGFDCSGMVGYVFKTALGIELPRVSREMASSGTPVERSALTPGDLVFFGVHGHRVDHVGIYVGEGRFVHAPRTGRDVTVSSLDGGYWSGKFLQARRVAGI